MDDLENLLMLDGEIFQLESGNWVKFEARRVKSSREMPHGVKYSLTLHDKNNRRVPGYDNAHSFKSKNGKFTARKVAWDHQHKKDEVFPYTYVSALQLIEDFWKSVEYCMKQ